MNRAAAPLPPPATRSAPPARPPAVPPLLPVVLPLVVTAIVLAVAFARWFPAAGPAVHAGAARFTNVTAESGVRFTHGHGAGDADDSPTTLGAGVVVFDFNRDGRPDLFFVNGTAWPWEEPPAGAAPRTAALLRNDGGMRFTDVTAAAGLAAPLQGMGAAAGDFDGDGFADLFVTCVGANRLFRNRGDGGFEDVTDAAGVAGDEHTWSTAAVWLDVDRDGRPDLVVAHYARWPHDVPLALAFTIADVGRSYGAPAGFVPAFPTVYRNLGGGRFAALAGNAGLLDRDPQTGLPVAKPLALVPLDANGDGLPDLVFSYHTGEPSLFLNQGDGTFRRASRRDDRHEGASAGLASATAGAANGGDERTLASLAPPPALGAPDDATLLLARKSGGALLDAELDGHVELFAGGGRAERDLNKFEGGRDFAASPRLFRFQSGTWSAVATPVSDGETAPWSAPLVARGVAAADLDGDGDADVIVTQHRGPAQIFRNDQRGGLPWLRLQLVATRSEPSATGARVEVHTPRRVHVQSVAPAMGLFAQSENTLTFGLGDDARVRRVVIHWPSGQRQEFRPEGLNREWSVREP